MRMVHGYVEVSGDDENSAKLGAISYYVGLPKVYAGPKMNRPSAPEPSKWYKKKGTRGVIYESGRWGN